MFKKTDLSGIKIWNLEVIEEIKASYTGKEKNRKTVIKLKCKCSCGNIFYPYKSNVKTGKTKNCASCGNVKKIINKIGKINIVRLIPSQEIPHKKSGSYYECLCDCGNFFISPYNILRRLKGKYCTSCRPVKKKTMTMEESHRLIGLKKHLKSKNAKIGKTFFNYRIISFSNWLYKNKRRYSIYKCKCKCGIVFYLRSDHTAIVKSCGCLQKKSVLKGENHPFARLKNKEISSIKELLKLKIYRQKEIARMYDVGEWYISAIKKGKTWKIIPDSAIPE